MRRVQTGVALVGEWSLSDIPLMKGGMKTCLGSAVECLGAVGLADRTGFCGPLMMLSMLQRWERLWLRRGGCKLTFSSLSIVDAMLDTLKDPTILISHLGDPQLVERTLNETVRDLRNYVATQASSVNCAALIGELSRKYIEAFRDAEAYCVRSHGDNFSARQLLICLLAHHVCWLTPLLLVPTMWRLTDRRESVHPHPQTFDPSWYWIVIKVHSTVTMRVRCSREEDADNCTGHDLWDPEYCIGVCLCQQRHWEFIPTPLEQPLEQGTWQSILGGLTSRVNVTLAVHAVDWQDLAVGGNSPRIFVHGPSAGWSVTSPTALLHRRVLATPGGLNALGNRGSEGKGGWLAVCELHKSFCGLLECLTHCEAHHDVTFLDVHRVMYRLLHGESHFLRNNCNGLRKPISLSTLCRNGMDAGIVLACTWELMESAMDGCYGLHLPTGFKYAASRAKDRARGVAQGSCCYVLKELLDLDFGWLSPFLFVPMVHILCDKRCFKRSNSPLRLDSDPSMLWYWLVVVPLEGGEPHVFRAYCEATPSPGAQRHSWVPELLVGVARCLQGRWEWLPGPPMAMVSGPNTVIHDWTNHIPWAYEFPPHVTYRTLSVVGLGDPCAPQTGHVVPASRLLLPSNTTEVRDNIASSLYTRLNVVLCVPVIDENW
jgi:hypothetical protein